MRYVHYFWSLHCVYTHVSSILQAASKYVTSYFLFYIFRENYASLRYGCLDNIYVHRDSLSAPFVWWLYINVPFDSYNECKIDKIFYILYKCINKVKSMMNYMILLTEINTMNRSRQQILRLCFNEIYFKYLDDKILNPQ